MTGTWGTGARSRFDFDLVIDDLGRVPDDDLLATVDRGPASRMFVPEIFEEDVPDDGLAVEVGAQIIEHDEHRSWVRDV